MKAYVLREINKIHIEEVTEPVPKLNEVVVEVKAAGICGSDIPRAYKTGAHVHPIILGHEFSGQVVEIGQNVQKEWLGKRVGVFPLIPCGECEQCRQKKYEMCKKYSYLGSRTDGGLAEKVAVPVWNLVELNTNISYEQAAMLEPMAVAVHAMRQVDIKRANTVVVCGLGTIGLMLVMFLKEAGIQNVYVIGNKNIQKENAMSFGIEDSMYCDGKICDAGHWIKDKTNNRGVDIFFECVGKNETVAMAVDSVASSGTVILVGNPYGDMCFEKNVYWKMLRNQLTVKGTWNSSYVKDASDDWNYVLDRLNKNVIEPQKLITHRFMLSEVDRGFEIMKNKSEEYTKIVILNK